MIIPASSGEARGIDSYLDDLLVNYYLPPTWSARIWMRRDLPVHLALLVPRLGEQTVWRAYRNGAAVLFAVGHPEQPACQNGSAVGLTVDLLDEFASIYHSSSWQYDVRRGWRPSCR